MSVWLIFIMCNNFRRLLVNDLYSVVWYAPRNWSIMIYPLFVWWRNMVYQTRMHHQNINTPWHTNNVVIPGSSKISTPNCHYLITPWAKWPPFCRRYFQMHFREWKVLYFDKKFTDFFVSDGSIASYPALVWIMAWRRIGDKPLSEAMLTRFTDAYMQHQREIF